MKAVPFGAYQLLEPIKSGGMSEIWRARQNGSAAVVAVKRLLPTYAKDPEVLGMFLDEARVAVQLSHPNIVRVFDLGRVGDELYIAMEYAPGSDLRAIYNRAAKRGSLMPIPLVLFVVARICDALDYAHRRTDASGAPLQIVHRDIAPDNCLVTFDGEVKLIDFGVAKAASQTNKTRVGVLKGKLSYMSPEQVIGKQVDRRSDIFSMGVVLYEMVTGKRLFWHESPLQTFEAVRGAAIEPPSEVNPKVPEMLEQVILTALQRDLSRRYEWASEMSTGLRACLAGLRTLPTAAHLRKYMSLMFVNELKAERDRRTDWAQAHVPGHVPQDGEALEGGDFDEGAVMPTLMERPKPSASAPASAPAPAPSRTTPAKPAAISGRTARPPPPPDPVPEEEDFETEDRPTVLGLSQLPGMEVPDSLLAPGEELPPPLPSPDRPTHALEVFVEEAEAHPTPVLPRPRAAPLSTPPPGAAPPPRPKTPSLSMPRPAGVGGQAPPKPKTPSMSIPRPAGVGGQPPPKPKTSSMSTPRPAAPPSKPGAGPSQNTPPPGRKPVKKD